MVTNSDKRGKQKGKRLHLLATITLWAVVLFIVYDVGQYMYLYYQTTQRVNRAVELNNREGESLKAIRELEKVRVMLQKEQEGIAPIIFQRLIGTSFNFSKQFAVLYRNMGQYHTRRQESKPAIRAYMLALIQDPSQKKAIKKLGEECVLNKNYEFGYLASKAAQREDLEGADQLSRFFKKHYQNPAKSK